MAAGEIVEMIDQHDPDVMCITCGLRRFSGCTCPKAEPSNEEIEFARESRLVRAERRGEEAGR